VPLSVAQFGTVDDLVAVARHYAEHGLSPVVADGEKYYIDFPGFRDPARGFPDEWFDATAQARGLMHQVGPADVRWGRTPDGRPALLAGLHCSLANLDHGDREAPVVYAGDRRSAHVETGNDEAGGSRILGYLPLDEIVAGQTQRRRRRRVRFTWTMAGRAHTLPVTAADAATLPSILYRRGLRFYRVGADLDEDSVLRVVSTVVTPRRVVGRLVRRLRPQR
jgi:hypothetical protein